MSNLTYIEKQILERELGMGGGHVLEFTNRRFADFFRDVLGIQIYEPQFALGSGSKANRMRAFWQIATEEQLQILLSGLLETWEIHAQAPISDASTKAITKILVRLGGNASFAGQESRSSALPTNQLGAELSKRLGARLLEVSALPRQKRGYELERFFRELFDAYGLAARASFRLTGEQIDGSFLLNNETYLLEAKWQNAPTGAADLHTFEGKLGERANWSRGLFVSSSGFTPEGLRAFGRGKRLVCMDGFDLSEMLRLQLSFIDVLTAKVRRAAETGSPHTSVRDLFI